MKFLATAAFLAAAASAATTTTAAADSTASSSCAAENIVQACLGTEKALLSSCGSTDYECNCNAYTNIVTCFNNCPNDPARYTYQQSQQIYCGYASQYPSSTKAKAAATNTGTTTTGAATATDTTGAAGTKTGTGTGTATNAAKTNSGADLVLNAGSMLVAVAGMVAALL